MTLGRRMKKPPVYNMSLDPYERAALGAALCIVSPIAHWPDLIALDKDEARFPRGVLKPLITTLIRYRKGCRVPEIKKATARILERALILKSGHPLERLVAE